MSSSVELFTLINKNHPKNEDYPKMNGDREKPAGHDHKTNMFVDLAHGIKQIAYGIINESIPKLYQTIDDVEVRYRHSVKRFSNIFLLGTLEMVRFNT